jgi:hypothetical protein
MVWAGADLAFDGSRLGLNLLGPLGQGEGSSSRPPAPLDDMIVQSEGDIAAQSDGSGIEIVPAAAFVHNGLLNSTTQAEDWFFSFAGGVVRNSSANEVCMSAPVYLQPGSLIDRFTVYLVDNQAPANLTVFFDRTDDFDFGFVELARVQSSGSSSALRVLTDPSITAGAVLPGFNYHITFCLPPGTSILVKGARISYVPPTEGVFLPLLFKSTQVVPTTRLTVKNSTGGTVIYYRIRRLSDNAIVAQCPANMPNGAEQFCGPTFPSGTYTVEGSFSQCGSGTTTLTFPSGNCLRTVTCPSEGGQQPSMQCN